MVLCECYDNDGTANSSNYRAHCKKVMDAAKAEEPWFGLEQEYTLFDADGQVYGWPKMGFPGPQGPYYCGVGTGKVFARDFIEAHYVSHTARGKKRADSSRSAPACTPV
jgi:glutamine synthetase